jgi:hypothetical protein
MIRITTLYSEFYLHTDLLMVKQTCMLAFTHAFVLTLKVQISPILAFGLNVPRVIMRRNHLGRHTLAFGMNVSRVDTCGCICSLQAFRRTVRA